ncbi:hypothetical protein BFP72_11860 [Reichenbachiella sp. 5M10]|uniref:nucleoid-structuring protein H-NS n=1 Tax=Reichenbachiella sp. 5M10 TaxID=1889772 RepID=UPI000C5E4DB2|nr:nucleoid-structuring protein H-NS [Reichenbachiella sp. 5M10]PIB36042.1 hypothetical protein BFP72_11860 [Reichenbachiella sp. 5M10]
MSKHIPTFPYWPMAVLMAIVIGFSSCKSQKKLTKSEDVPVVTTVAPEPEPEPEPEVIEAPAPKKLTKEERLTNYFDAIATSSTTDSANASIDEALTMFSDGDAPVLIVIYKGDGSPSYDEPTTIENYLHYLKDTQNNNTEIEEIVYDTDGNIKELVLKK